MAIGEELDSQRRERPANRGATAGAGGERGGRDQAALFELHQLGTDRLGGDTESVSDRASGAAAGSFEVINDAALGVADTGGLVHVVRIADISQ